MPVDLFIDGTNINQVHESLFSEWCWMKTLRGSCTSLILLIKFQNLLGLF